MTAYNMIYDIYFRLLTAGSIEEKIFQRQISKTGLSGAVVDHQNQSKIRLSNEELKVHEFLRCKKYYEVTIWEEDWSYLHQYFWHLPGPVPCTKIMYPSQYKSKFTCYGYYRMESNFLFLWSRVLLKKLTATQPVK
jgi:hypothetical protein